jgi:hypothetical protein
VIHGLRHKLAHQIDLEISAAKALDILRASPDGDAIAKFRRPARDGAKCCHAPPVEQLIGGPRLGGFRRVLVGRRALDG